MASCALLHAFRAQGKSAVGMKPVAAGCNRGHHEDVEMLVAASSVRAPRQWVNPYLLTQPIAPHIAAEQEGILIRLAVIKQAYASLQAKADVVIVEGVGGFRVPLSARKDSADLAAQLGLPVILVVGMRLGCLNHALLTSDAVRARGLHLAGWVANSIAPAMAAFDENLRALEARLRCPLLGIIPFQRAPNPRRLSRFLQIARLNPERPSRLP